MTPYHTPSAEHHKAHKNACLKEEEEQSVGMVVCTYKPSKHWRGGGRRITSSLRVWATRDLLWREARGEKTKSSQHHKIGLNKPGEKEFCYCYKGTWPEEASWPLYSVSSLECANKKTAIIAHFSG